MKTEKKNRKNTSLISNVLDIFSPNFSFQPRHSFVQHKQITHLLPLIGTTSISVYFEANKITVTYPLIYNNFILVIKAMYLELYTQK